LAGVQCREKPTRFVSILKKLMGKGGDMDSIKGRGGGRLKRDSKTGRKGWRITARENALR